MKSGPQPVTQLLRKWGDGNLAARDELMPLVYEELRRIARRHMMRQQAGRTLQTTDLIHEAYLKIADGTQNDWQSRVHFFGVAAAAMRHILVDRARARHAAKRGGGNRRVPLDEAQAGTTERAGQLIALDDALKELEMLHRRQAQVIELRFFGGLSAEETATLLNVSVETITRDWRTAKAWLSRDLNFTSPTK